MEFNKYDFLISGRFAPSIVNGDHSGLNVDDEELLEKFLRNLRDELGPGHWSFGDSEQFDYCDVCDLMAVCFEAEYLVPVS